MRSEFEFTLNTSTSDEILRHLEACDASFEPSLSGRVDLAKYAEKLAIHATRFEFWSDGILSGLLALYLKDGNETAFISNLSVIPSQQRTGIGAQLLRVSINYLKVLGIRCVLLEVGAASSAHRFYLAAGFRFVGFGSKGSDAFHQLEYRVHD